MMSGCRRCTDVAHRGALLSDGHVRRDDLIVSRHRFATKSFLLVDLLSHILSERLNTSWRFQLVSIFKIDARLAKR